MDFPIDLRTNAWAVGKDEHKQDIIILLKNSIGEFFQSVTIGAKYSIHSPAPLLQEGIKSTLLEIPGLQVNYVDILSEGDHPEVRVSVVFRGDTQELSFTL